MFDFNIKYKLGKEKERQLVVKRIYELGWHSIAWNIIVLGKVNSSQHRPIAPITLERIQWNDAIRNRSLVCTHIESYENSTITQYSRVTVIVDDIPNAQLLSLGNENISHFDIVAATTSNLEVFNYLCKTAEIDIISLDFTHRIPFMMNKKVLDIAVKRGISFEIIYSPMISVSGSRKEIIAGTKVLLQYLRGRNIIISSGTDSMLSLRGPNDVINIGMLLGIKQHVVSKWIGENCMAVLNHAKSRKVRYSPVELTTLSAALTKYNIPEEKFRKKMYNLGQLIDSSNQLQPFVNCKSEHTLGNGNYKLNDDDNNESIEEENQLLHETIPSGSSNSLGIDDSSNRSNKKLKVFL